MDVKANLIIFGLKTFVGPITDKQTGEVKHYDTCSALVMSKIHNDDTKLWHDFELYAVDGGSQVLRSFQKLQPGLYECQVSIKPQSQAKPKILDAKFLKALDIPF